MRRRLHGQLRASRSRERVAFHQYCGVWKYMLGYSTSRSESVLQRDRMGAVPAGAARSRCADVDSSGLEHRSVGQGCTFYVKGDVLQGQCTRMMEGSISLKARASSWSNNRC